MVGRLPPPPAVEGGGASGPSVAPQKARSVPFTDLPSEGNLTYATASGQ